MDWTDMSTHFHVSLPGCIEFERYFVILADLVHLPVFLEGTQS